MFAQLAVASMQQISGVQIAIDSLKPTQKYTESVHFVITEFSLFHL